MKVVKVSCPRGRLFFLDDLDEIDGKFMSSAEQTSTKQDILEYLLKHGRGTAHDLAEALGITPQAIRRHLKELEAEDAIAHDSEQAGIGRPQHLYYLSRKGRERFPANYDRFSVELLDTLAETVGPEGVGRILHKQWQRRAQEYRDRLGCASLETRLARLADLRREEGYVADWYPLDDGSGYILTEYNCAISQIAESFPSVCGHELDMFAEALPDCAVERTHWMVDGEHRCGYAIRLRSPVLPSARE